ncbi:hypothetical protein [Bdellovibrio sp. HCB209]|uniref:hypothetical protein n=1 Tax=Bdellovibrio sp. HCB209 TaxID=3394354 RepID=UPI0039B6DED9
MAPKAKKAVPKVAVKRAKKAEKRVIRGFNLRESTIKNAQKKAKELGYSLNGFIEAVLIEASK